MHHPTARQPLPPSLSRRGFATGLAGATLVAGTGPAYADHFDRLVVATSGSDRAAAIRSAWLDPFADATGAAVLTAVDPTYERLRAMVSAHKVDWDVVEITPALQGLAARDGLLEKLDFKVIDPSGISRGPELVSAYSVADVLWSHVMFCNTAQFAEGRQPLNWAGVWNANFFPGKRSLPASANSGVLEAALMADGVAPEQLYPLDIDRALTSLSHIKEHIVWWASDSQSQQIMLEGQAVLGLITDQQALTAIDRGAPISVQYNQSLLTWYCLAVPKDAPNRAAAMAFINYALTPEAQAAIATADTFGPVAPAAFEQLAPHRAAMLSGGPEQQGSAVWVDESWWAQNLSAATAKLAAWRAS